MDDALSSKTHAWTCKQACKDAQKANGWHKQAWQAYHQAEWKKKEGRARMERPGTRRHIPNGYT